MNTYTCTFHGTTYEPTIKGPKDSSSTIALGFVTESRETAHRLSDAGRELAKATEALTRAIEDGLSFKEIESLQEQYASATREFDALHRAWSAQSSSALTVFGDHWGEGYDASQAG
ncbi:hypothetical protein ABZZ80_05065 [Streptomyces sp. NPDC006356]